MDSRITGHAVVAVERMRRLGVHMVAATEEVPYRPGLALAACLRARKVDFDAPRLAKCMRGKHRNVQEKVYEYFLSRPELQTSEDIRKDDHCELCLRQLIGFVMETGIRTFR